MTISTKTLRVLMIINVVCLVAGALWGTYNFIYFPDKHLSLNGLGPILMITFLGINSLYKKRKVAESSVEEQ